MLTDIFANRYTGVTLWTTFTELDQRFLVQAFRIISEQIYKYYTYKGDENTASKKAWNNIHAKVSMELGVEDLSPRWARSHTYNIHDVCKNFVFAKYDESVSPDRFMKNRLSLIEIAFRERHNEIEQANAQLPAALTAMELHRFPPGLASRTQELRLERMDEIRQINDTMNRAFRSSSEELNARLQQARYELHYHNGFIQRSAEPLMIQEIEQAFWSLISGALWQNVDTDMKEAIDLRDNNGRDPSFYAARALESTIKIISKQNGWTHGGEKGAHNYIDNLRSKKNGEFINEWEMRSLKEFFSNVRNPFGHGPGDAKMPSLTAPQTDWAIALCMIWIKNLIRRM